MADPLSLLSRYVHPGDLVFDIGAHEGKHSSWFLKLGAHVIAVEPQAALAERIPPHAKLEVLNRAVSDQIGTADFYVSPGHEYVSTLEEGYLERVQTHADYPYEPPIQVPTTTLDELIDYYGVPAFAKIDVEGHERAVLAGLSTALPALSFEVHDFDSGKAADCIARLDSLGEYRYQYSPREDFVLGPWPAVVDIFGDVYAEWVA